VTLEKWDRLTEGLGRNARAAENEQKRKALELLRNALIYTRPNFDHVRIQSVAMFMKLLEYVEAEAKPELGFIMGFLEENGFWVSPKA
jgi:hypothetical protein